MDIRTYTHTHIHAHIMTYLYFLWLLLKKFVLRCNGATKLLKSYIQAEYSRCTLFINHATFTRL